MLHFGKKQTELSEELTKLYKRLQKMEKRMNKRSRYLFKLQQEWNEYALTYLYLQHASTLAPARSGSEKPAAK